MFSFTLIIYFTVVILVFSLILYPPVSYAPAARLPPWLKENFIEIQGRTVRYFTYFPSGDAKICVLHHGLGDSSEALSGEAELLKKLGFAILMVDLLGHGKSEKVATSFGREESRVLLDLINQLELRERIAIMWGRSTGAAVVLFISSRILNCQALILDGLFETEINSIWRHAYRMKKYWASLPFLPIVLGFLFLLKFRKGCPQEPLQEIQKSQMPMLFIAGSADVGAGPDVQEKLYEASNSEESKLVILDGPVHNQCFTKDPQVYEDWLKIYL